MMSNQHPIFMDQPDGPYVLLEDGLLPYHKSLLLDCGGHGAREEGALPGPAALYAWIAVAIRTTGGDWSALEGVDPAVGAPLMDALDPYPGLRRRLALVRRLPVEAVNRLGDAALRLGGIGGEEKNSAPPSE